MIIDLRKPEHAYFYGFALTDGHLREGTRNRGSLSIEVAIRDTELLQKFKTLFEVNSIYKERFRETNFTSKKKAGYCSFSIYDLNFRNELKEYGFPVGKKSDIISPPLKEFSEIDFIRGLIDGDGSVGLTSKGLPFISFTTASEDIRNYVVNFINKTLNRNINPQRNKRDNIYNIVIQTISAQQLYKILYYDNCLCLTRKNHKEILNWKPQILRNRVIPAKRWNKDEDHFILTHTIEESIKELNRTYKSIYKRLWTLKNHMVN